MPDIDIGALSEAINDKMDRDAHNVQSPTAVIVETYNDGIYWYRVYSDGWCEQGGYLYQPGATGEAYHTVTFLKPFINNLYYIQLSSGVGTSGWQYANGASIGYGGCITRDVFASTSSMQLAHAVGAGNVALFWEVKGYIS